MRRTLLLVSVGLLSIVSLSACATAVVPSAAEAEGKTEADAAASNPSDYSSGGDAGTGGTGGSGGLGGKSDSGTSGGGGGGGGSCAFTGALATFDFTGESGSQTSTPSASKATGVIAGDVKRASALTAVSGSDSMNASGWTTASHADSSKYYTLSLTPPSGCTLDITSISVDTSASNSGPSNGAVATSADSFAAQTNFITGAAHSVAVSVSGATGATELRVYGYGASSTGGTMRLQSTLTVTGALK